MEEEDSTNQEKEQPNGIKDEKKENIPEGSEGSNEADQKDENLSPEEKIKELEDITADKNDERVYDTQTIRGHD